MLIVTANSQKELDTYLNSSDEQRPDAVILAWPDLSLRQQVFFDKKQIQKAVRDLKKAGFQVYLNLLKMVMEEDLEKTEEAIRFCKEEGVDGMYIADEGYIPLAPKYGIQDRLIYQPETLVVNAMDVNFYKNQNFLAVSLANELALDQVLQIAKEAEGLEVLVQGRYSWMYSYRPLIENYLKEIHGPDFHSGPGIYSLQEANREDILPVEQTKSGTIVYTGTPKNSLSVLPELHKAGIDRFRIDTYLEPDDYGIKQIQLYKTLLDAADQQAALEQLHREYPDWIIGSDADWHTKTSLRKEKD